MRLPANEILQGNIRHLLKRPVGRPPKKPVVRYHDFVYQAQSWDIPRRVVAKVEWRQGELFPRVGFVVTNLNLPPAGVTHYYNGRGTAEQWIKEGKYVLNWTRLSCHRFVANQVRLWLFVLAYNLGNFMRRLTLPESVKHWSLRSVQTKLIKFPFPFVSSHLLLHAASLRADCQWTLRCKLHLDDTGLPLEIVLRIAHEREYFLNGTENFDRSSNFGHSGPPWDEFCCTPARGEFSVAILGQ